MYYQCFIRYSIKFTLTLLIVVKKLIYIPYNVINPVKSTRTGKKWIRIVIIHTTLQ